MNNKDLSRFYPDNLEGSSDFVRHEEVNELASSDVESISQLTYRKFEIEYETGFKVMLPIEKGVGISTSLNSTKKYIQIALNQNYQHLAAHIITINYGGTNYYIYLISQRIAPCTILNEICYSQGDFGLDPNGYVFYYEKVHLHKLK